MRWIYEPRWLDPGSELSPLVKYARSISAHNIDPDPRQDGFAFGNPGTESGHTLDTEDTNRTVQEDGNGNYAFFLRIQLWQDITNADQNLTQTFKLKAQRNGTGGYTDVTASSSYVQVVANGDITDGGATSERLTAPSSGTWLNGEIDEGDGTWDSITWTQATVQYTELLISLQIIDADMNADDYLDFRVYYTSDTALNGGVYDVTPRLIWEAPAASEVPVSAYYRPHNTLIRM